MTVTRASALIPPEASQRGSATPTTSLDAGSADSTVVRSPGAVRRALGWVVISALVIGVALVGILVTVENPTLREGLDPDGAGYSGSLAAAELLRQQGIEVVVVRDRFAAAREIDDESTLAFTEPAALSDDAVLAMIENAPRVVSLSGSSRMVRLLELGESLGSVGTAAVAPRCSAPEFAGISELTPGRLFIADPGVTACFSTAEGAGVLIGDATQTRVIADGSRLFTNESLANADNAALALALLGQHPRVVWYVPSFADSDLSDSADSDTLAALTPSWVTPAILLLITAAIGAGVWRGRRFGPLVAETLPVTVRASETMHGRARLTAKAGDAAHAAEALRAGTLRRLARRLRLSPTSTPEAVSDAVADRLNTARASVRDVLLAPVPTADTHLVDYARRLADVEAAIDTMTANERTTP